jgi:hypothetical protein
MGITKAACDCCDKCGPDCKGGCCDKCTSVKLEDAYGMSKSANEVIEESQSKTSLDMINDAKADLLSKSVWGGAFGAPGIPRIK